MKVILQGRKNVLSWVLFLFFAIISQDVNSQVTDHCILRTDRVVPLNRLALVPDVEVSPAPGRLYGYIEYKPADYNPERQYGLIIFFHGLSGRGNGNGTLANYNSNFNVGGLCNMIGDSWPTILGLVDNMVPGAPDLPEYILDNYIIFAPQYRVYRFGHATLPDDYPNAESVEDAIDFAINTYGNIDENAIVLTGLSSGANMIAEYMGSSQARAERVQFANIISNCTQIGVDPISANAATNIAASGARTWFVGCINDATCPFPLTSENWVTSINAASPVNPAILNAFENEDCLLGTLHNAWTTFYHPNFNEGPDNMNLYDYIEVFASVNATLPVNLKSYHARLANDRVLVEWVTTTETNNSYFSIERAGEDQQFKEIARVQGRGNSSNEVSYSYSDISPLKGVSYYRLVQVDLDGKTKVYTIKKIVNTSLNGNMVVSPNPFNEKLSVYLNLPSSKKLTIYISDMNGRRLVTQSQVFKEGSQEFQMNTSNLPRGMYFLRIEGDGISESQKIIKR